MNYTLTVLAIILTPVLVGYLHSLLRGSEYCPEYDEND